MTHQNIGFIGLGQMGSGMAQNLLPHVSTLYVSDTNPQAVESLVSVGALECATPQEIARHCEIIFLCLPDTAPVQQTIFGPNGITAAQPKSLTIIDTTTQDRADAISLATDAKAAGINYCDCPVSGLPARALDGTLTVMFGGSRQIFDQTSHLLNHFGQDIRYCGDIGCGQAMKAINNVIYNINIAALCEMLPLATAIGLDPEQVGSVVTSASSRSFASSHFVPKMLERHFSNDFTLKNAYKDIANVQRMAIETKAMTPVANAMISTYQSAMAAGYDNEPKSAMLKIYEDALGVKFEKKTPV